MKRLILILLILFLACEDEQVKDCAGVEGGTAMIDSCGVCDENPDNNCLIDYDGNIYEVARIGNQIWTIKNLNVTHYQDGSAIQTGYSNYEWSSPFLPFYSTGVYAVYNDDTSNIAKYGNLYNWYAVDDSRGICPEGWHIPSDDEWKELELYLGICDGSLGNKDSYVSSDGCVNNIGWIGTNEGGMIKEDNTEHWNTETCTEPVCPDGSTGCNCSGFTAMPGGFRYYLDGFYNGMGYGGYFWSSTESSSHYAWYRQLGTYNSEINRNNFHKAYGFSIRCVRD